ncbi:MAG: EAL domain-containing protein [Proteobacteria bacterium]|nr:EAL domain-containing protein [Pseudomonadota bacterium]
MRQVAWVVLGVFAALTVLNLFRERWVSAVFDFGVVALLGLALWRNARGQSTQAIQLMVVSLALGLMALMFAGQGLYDEAPMAYPTLVVLAAMLGARRLTRVLVAVLLASLMAMFLLDQAALLPSIPDSPLWVRLAEMGLILLVTWMLVQMISDDLRQAIGQLEGEKLALQQSQQENERLVQSDALTGLPNRLLARDRLEQLLVQGVDSDRFVAVIFLDIDNFKTVNDSLGHAAGDALLLQVAVKLRASLRDTDTVARISGDEFVILLGNLKSEHAIATVIAKINRVFREAFSVNGMDVLVTASMGITVSPRDGEDVDVLLKNADLAMYEAKDSGRNTFRFFNAHMNDSVAEQLQLASGLRTALGNGELRVHYQPQIDLADGRIVGAEALLRWLHPERGYIPPAVFIPVAERCGLIHEIGDWVLQQACRDAQAWRALGLGELMVAVNVSPLQLRRDDFDVVVADTLADTGLPGESLELELTESSLVLDTRDLVELLQRLRRHGVRIAIDDFGTGYSNLGYLRRLAVHRLKIDRSFVDKICVDASDEALVRAIVEMAHCLNLSVIAEGVENEAALQRLRSLGCEGGQGYLWSQALPLDGFVALVRAQTKEVGTTS